MNKTLILCFLLIKSLSSVAQNPSFFRGADISWLTEMEKKEKIKYYTPQGKEQECMSLLKDIGMNAVRLRVWVHPEDGWNGADDVLDKAIRAKANGLSVMVDFHYSDTWADPGHQSMPKAWESDNIESVADSVYQHTIFVLEQLKNKNVDVKWIQVGNETPAGMLWPLGKLNENGKNFSILFKAGTKACREVFPKAKVIVHIDNGYDNRRFTYVLDRLRKNGAEWDVIGMSLYPDTLWRERIALCKSNIEDLFLRYGTPSIICEVGMNRSLLKQSYDYLTHLRVTMENLPGNLCQGVFYWEPECYKGEHSDYLMGAFTDDGRPTTALQALLSPDEPKTAYLAAYMKGTDEHSMYYAICDDGTYNFREINGGKPIVKSNLNDKLLRDPMLFKDNDNIYHLIATVSWKNRPFIIWDSKDLINWENERLVDVAPKNSTKTWAPEIVYDSRRDEYMAYWTSDIKDKWETASIYGSTTKDFKEWSKPFLLYSGDGKGILDANIKFIDNRYRMIYRGDGGIPVASSYDLHGPYKKEFMMTEENVEGPYIFELNEGGYGVVWDYFGNSQGFGLMTSPDFMSWVRITNIKYPYYTENVSFPNSIRHGSIIGITESQKQSLIDQFP